MLYGYWFLLIHYPTNLDIIKKTYPVQPSEGYIQLRIFNGIPDCSYTLGSNLTGYERISINGLGLGYEKFIYIENKTLPLKYTVQEQTGCPKLPGGTFTFKEKLAYSIFLQNKILPQSAHVYLEEMEKSNKANPLVRNLANINPDSTIVWKSHKTGDIESTKKANNREIIELRATTYDVLIDNVKVHEVTLRHGGVYSLVMGIDEHDTTVTQLAEVIKANSMSILWLIPQYVVMTLGEVMFSVTGLEFSYSQSPVTMKSVLQACWLLTVAFGNVIVVIVAEAKIFKSQANEFFLFAGLMFADMIVFIRYKTLNHKEIF
ncbi:peptide transporter family 1-like [Musca domestica]|uniref:Peptide transporter family 1-like n=1 Tax=Musca domestica TaxID=7370 RepID=A0ABM3VJ26_MUSDO|nr:peptide transporter family 1-like [Musca domestica]